ncbi:MULTISPECIES: DUF1592 domain-containing protein [Sorangium]|uniref:Uncharacterized protein n=1 Tax=Sorangium cellulosum TaxID=56 RepID=A0A4V0NF95_SORCE|nr:MULTISPECIES: DUF1592 domain-containing protein [Sorangium]AUX28892.1 hypothetical protein SOCE836_009770 [Sorangium cellulosum]WCQ88287.1 hypothetical protein NQZ70_00962 [Sorangium sp. Soce836]
MSRPSHHDQALPLRGARSAILAALLLASGCIGNLGDSSGAEPGDKPGAEPGVEDPTPGAPLACKDGVVYPGRAPLRRLTRVEYNNTVRDLLGDTTDPAFSLPSEDVGNGFGNDADTLSVSSLLAEQLGTVAEGVAQRATATPEALAKLAPCARNVAAADEAACARTIIESLAPVAYRRPLAGGEAEELLALYSVGRTDATFATGVATMIEALLQSPDFLYRIEWGTPDPERPQLRRPTGDEMATRLSYLLWGTMPDEELRMAAQAGELSTKEGVRKHAERMLDDDRSRPTIRFFFDNLLPISSLADLERNAEAFPTFSRTIGSLMREETQRFLEHEIFEGTGSWASILTAPYTFMNERLAAFYGVSGVKGDEFQKVELDTTQRLGLLTQAGVMAGTTHSNNTNPVVRGSFVLQKLMCIPIPLPTGDILEKVKPPDPYSGATARDRFSQHSKDKACAGCHQFMDPVGFAFENYDAVGLYRTTENDVVIDPSGTVPGTLGDVSGPIELVQKLAASEEVQHCFAKRWSEFAYGLTLRKEDQCTEQAVTTAFEASGYNVKQLLIDLTQTDAFHYLASGQE